MLRLFAQSLWLSLPVAIAGILHMVLVKKDLLPFLRVPMDGGRTLRGKRLFGDNKTWRGFLFMPVASALLGLAQGFAGGAWADGANAACMDFAALGRSLGAPAGVLAYAVGYKAVAGALGLGYAIGELPNSLVKRQLDIVPGRTEGGLLGAVFVVIDHIDSIAFALVMGALIFPISWSIVLAGVIALPFVHVSLDAILYALKLRKNF